MAKAEWCNVTPMTGNGNKTISISAVAHTGRVARSTTVTVQNKNGAKPSKSIAVTQAAKELFITKISGPTPASISASGGTVVITGKSNAKMIALFENWGDLLDSSELRVNGQLQTDIRQEPVAPYYLITGDIGASGEYTFELKATFPQNGEAEARTLELHIQGCNQNEPLLNDVDVVIMIPQAGAASNLSIDKSSISIATVGTPQNISLSSNDNWVVS